MAKAAVKAMADVITERATNRELFDAIKRKKARSKRTTANLGKSQVMSMAVVDERRKGLNEKQFKKEAYYLNAISFSIFDGVVPGSPKKYPKKSTQKKPTAPAKSVPGTIPALFFDLVRGTHNLRYSWIHRCIDEFWKNYGYVADFIKNNVKKRGFF
jgi:hypothetical protein